jgi:CubicO group peptidase (beta-lactamase class C family)
MKLSRYLDARLFAPLGMRDTAFAVPAEKVARYAKALSIDPVTRAPQALRDGTKPHKFDCGGGCVVSTAADYLRFAQMLLNGGELDGTRILSRKTVQFMTADHLGPDVDVSKLNAYPNLDGYGFGLSVAVRRIAGRGGMTSSRRRVSLGGLHRHLLLGGSGRGSRRRVHGARTGRDTLLPPAVAPRAGESGSRIEGRE